ncbi:radical SAM protein [[Mycoplasma] testudinis]|uniref:radical SAM protein n=1 Tax=[Mycoplasma] testudinis TaxID=33924 RepID=UPI00055C5FF4|nr:radical SAM protein [[Mycoplasma] testudinis]
MRPQHLYIHIPLCKTICTFCDFKRELLCAHDPKKVLSYLLRKLKPYQPKQFKTIYLGGGTPNAFSNEELNSLLKALNPLKDNKCEFTIECNPDLVTPSQVQVLKKNKVNRISLGVQSTNNRILRLLNRLHTIETCSETIKLFQSYGFNNISADFIYALPLMKTVDVINAVKFIEKNNLQHASFYGLDLKPGAILTKQKYKIDLDDEADQLETAVKEFSRIGFERYEVSNWAKQKKYHSQHNLAYWYSHDWVGVGYGAHGFENQVAYEYTGSIQRPIKTSRKISDKDYYLQVLIMGLRLVDGINIKMEPYKSAYQYYKDKLHFVSIENHQLKCDNINLLNNSLLDLF